MRVGTNWWSLELEPGWSAVQDPECLTITRSKLGAFQLSAARRPERPAGLDELRAAAERESELMGPPLPVTCGGFKGFTVSYSREGAEWRRFWLGRGPLWIFATFNCVPSVRAVEEPEVERMLGTLKVEHGAA